MTGVPVIQPDNARVDTQDGASPRRVMDGQVHCGKVFSEVDTRCYDQDKSKSPVFGDREN